MSKTLNVVWYNIRGLKRKRSGVVSMMESSPDIDVLMLQEASCGNEKFKSSFARQLEMIGCILVCNKVNDRIMTIVRRESVQECRMITGNERVHAVEVACGDLKMTLVNHYGPHRVKEGDLHYVDVNDMIRELESRGKLFFGGDHNTVIALDDRSSNRLDENSSLRHSSKGVTFTV